MPEFRIYYQPLVYEDIAGINRTNLIRIEKAIGQKLATSPQTYGLPLRGTLKKYWKLRVGDYRVIFKMKPQIITVLLIAHRKKVYDLATKRLAR